MTCLSKCFYREDKIPGDGTCYLGLNGPMEVCQGYAPPTTVDPVLLDPEIKDKFRRIDYANNHRNT